MSLYVLLVIFGPSQFTRMMVSMMKDLFCMSVCTHVLGFAKWTRILRFVQKFVKIFFSVLRENFLS